MAIYQDVFVFLCCLIFVNSEVNTQNSSNNYETYNTEIEAVLKYLNSTPVKVYNYKQGTLINAHRKADIIELALDVSVDCINNYPDLPCTEKILTCNAFVRNTPEEGCQVLNDVKCKPKPEIIIEETPYIPSSTSTVEGDPNDTKSIALSNEAVSSEVGEHFVAVRRDSVPCLGCPFNLSPNAEGVDELVTIALGHIESERRNKQKLVKVLKLQQQVVSGIKYILLAEIAPTVCLKDANRAQESCPLDKTAVSSICQITYLHKPWISKSKHVISNNCTASQEFVISDDMNNEIDGGGAKLFVRTPNFDRIAETGTIEQMAPSKLEDLESQILVGTPEQSQLKIIDDFIVPSTVQSAISSSPEIFIENQPLEHRPSNIYNTEGSIEASQFPTEAHNVEGTVQTNKQRNISDDFVSAFYGNDENQQVNATEGDTERPKRSEESDSDSSESKDSLENDDALKPQRDSSEESKESQEANSTSVSEESLSEERTRVKRAIRQLEKISPEEKPLVKNLADFAAAALDNIDDDNQKRIILQILGAKKMVGDDGVYYHLIMRMGISRCLEDQVPDPNENCREKLFENYTKICKVQVYVNDEFTSPKVVKSQCQNIKRDQNDNRTNYSRFRREVLVGGLTEVDKNGAKIRELVREGLVHLNSQTNQDNKYQIAEVISATSQVVSGVIYRIKARISLSDCSINDEKDLDDCKVLKGSPSKVCDLKIWEKSWMHFRQTTITCENDDKVYKFETTRRKREVRPGGEFSVGKDDEFVSKYLESGLSHLDAESEHQNKFKVHEVVSVTNQIVAGHIYRIKAKIVLSDCKKTDTTAREQCGTLKTAQPKICDFKVFEALWIPNSRETNVTCDDDQKQYAFREKRDVLGRDDPKVNFELFTNFLSKYNKKYINKKEYKYRFKVFSDNLKHIRLLNAYEQGTATYGVTQFADLTQKEFSQMLGLREDLRSENEPPFGQAQIPDVKLPKAFDWRDKNAVTEVKDQGQCGSCWAFSVTGNVEGQYAIKHGKLLEFSEQELVDCDSDDQGCNGGLMDNAYRAIERMGGLETEGDYPYDAEDEKCHFNKSLARVQLTGALNISHNETDMAKWLVANGPISIGINANAMQFYFGGVSHPFKFLCNPKSLDHGVLIVGYGVHNYPLFKKSLPYWIVKNSWGKSWGEQGYYLVYRGDGTCGLNQTPTSAIVA